MWHFWRVSCWESFRSKTVEAVAPRSLGRTHVSPRWLPIISSISFVFLRIFCKDKFNPLQGIKAVQYSKSFDLLKESNHSSGWAQLGPPHAFTGRQGPLIGGAEREDVHACLTVCAAEGCRLQGFGQGQMPLQFVNWESDRTCAKLTEHDASYWDNCVCGRGCEMHLSQMTSKGYVTLGILDMLMGVSSCIFV